MVTVEVVKATEPAEMAAVDMEVARAVARAVGTVVEETEVVRVVGMVGAGMVGAE